MMSLGYFKKRKNDVFFIWLLLVCCIPALFGLFHSGFFVSDDGNWMVIRFAAFYKALVRGEFPTRFLPQLNHGYGYPVSDFLYPLFMYLGAPVKVLGMSFVNTIKIILGLSLVMSGAFSYLWLRKLFSSLASFVGALVYVYFPYHTYDLYIRGSVGEVLALCIIPFIFWQIESGNYLLISIGIALLIPAHNTLALLFLPVILLYLFFIRKYSLLLVGKVVLLALGLSAFFWIPALYDKQFTVFDKTVVSDVSQYFVTAKNFGLLSWFGLSVLIAGVFLLCGIYMRMMFLYRIRPSLLKGRSRDIFLDKEKSLFFFLVISIGFLFFVFPISEWFWRFSLLPFFVQFPFRFLSVVILGISYLTGYIVEVNRIKFIVSLLLLLLLFVSAFSYLSPMHYQYYPDGFYSTNQDTTTVKNEYMPVWVKTIPLHSPVAKVGFVHGMGRVDTIIQKGVKTSFSVHLLQTAVVRINTVYFPGIYVLVDGKMHPFSYGNQYGLLDVVLQKGVSKVVVGFAETPLRLTSDLVTGVNILLVGWLLYRHVRRSRS